MVSGIDLNSYTEHKVDVDGQAVIFKVGVIPTFMYLRLADCKDDNTKGEYLLRLCLRGWDNFDVPFRREKVNILGREIEAVPLEDIERIPPSWLPGIIATATKQLVLSMGEIKNSN